MLKGLPEITPQEGRSWILCASLMTPRPRVCSLLQLQPQGGEHGDRLQSHCSAPECFHQEEGQVTDELNRTSRIWTVSVSWVPDDKCFPCHQGSHQGSRADCCHFSRARHCAKYSLCIN